MLFENYIFKVVIINIKTKLMSVDEDYFHITEDEIKDLLKIIKEIKLDGNGVELDPIKFTIRIDDKENIIIGDSNTYENFDLLSDWIGDVYDKYN